ncbi:MAG: HEPN domain-containing protein [Thermodesulfovibrionales bacterium]
MSLTLEQKIIISDNRFEKAVEALNDAEQSLNAGMYRVATNRSFYAALYAAKSILILKGVDPIKHDGVKTMLALEFERKKIIPEGTIMKFKNLLDLRLTSDYDDLIKVDETYARNALSLARELVNLFKNTRNNLLTDLSKPST